MSGGLVLSNVTLPRAVPARVVVLAAAKLAGRRVTDVLQRDGFTVVANGMSAEELVARQDAAGDEHHRSGDHRSREPSRNCGVREDDESDRDET